MLCSDPVAQGLEPESREEIEPIGVLQDRKTLGQEALGYLRTHLIDLPADPRTYHDPDFPQRALPVLGDQL
jgi:hypothetical protein